MKKSIKRRKTVFEHVETRCNKCNEKEEVLGVFFHSFQVGNGYGDKHDFEIHDFDLCDECYCKMIKRFKVKVTTSFGGL